jgi:hypothetical protein
MMIFSASSVNLLFLLAILLCILLLHRMPSHHQENTPARRYASKPVQEQEKEKD